MLTSKNFHGDHIVFYVFCVDLWINIKFFLIQQLHTGFYNLRAECLQRGTDGVFKESCPRFVFKGLIFMCFVFIWEQTATCATYSINWLVFITEMKSVYSAVRTESLHNICFFFKRLTVLSECLLHLLLTKVTQFTLCYCVCQNTVLRNITVFVNSPAGQLQSWIQ